MSIGGEDGSCNGMLKRDVAVALAFITLLALAAVWLSGKIPNFSFF